MGSRDELISALQAARKFVRGRHSNLTYGPQALLDKIDNALATAAQPDPLRERHSDTECLLDLAELWQASKGDSIADKCMRDCGAALGEVLDMHRIKRSSLQGEMAKCHMETGALTSPDAPAPLPDTLRERLEGDWRFDEWLSKEYIYPLSPSKQRELKLCWQAAEQAVKEKP
jgi:hypothetical protein